MYLTHCINRSARATPDRIVTRCAGRETSRKQVQDRVARLAGGLEALGVKSDDRVAIQLALNFDRYLEFLFAGFWRGAVVVPVVGAEVMAQEITDHCRVLIAHYKCPSSVAFRTEPLPLSGAGKVLERDLRAPFWKGKTSGIN